MHTALRLGVRAAAEVRALNPAAHICFYGHYAWLNGDYLLGTGADSVMGGEVEAALLELVRGIESGVLGNEPVPSEGARKIETGFSRKNPVSGVHLARPALPLPDRDGLPDLSHYARYLANGRYSLSGYVEATRGCLHTCRHCPITPVYGGRFFVVPVETVMADVRAQVAAGAEHITFGDPDFLNGPGHAMRLARALHAEFPHLTFDFTTKVEHILRHRQLIPELRALGASFVVSAFESVSDEVLRRLDKGHTRADMDEALHVLAEARLPVLPTWLPFTPWTTLDDYLAMLAWIRERGLIANVPAVQLSVRLLVPPGSALLAESVPGFFGPLNAPAFSYEWRHPDPRMDELQARVTLLAANAPADTPHRAFAAVEQLAYTLAGRPPPQRAAGNGAIRLRPAPPRLTEDWFC